MAGFFLAFGFFADVIFGFGGVLSARRRISSRRFSLLESAMKKKPFTIQRVQKNVVQSIPDEYACQIGHVVSRFAMVELTMNSIIYHAIGIDSTIGRLVVGTGRLETQADKIVDILVATHLPVPQGRIRAVKKDLNQIERDRDALAHGVWIDLNGELVLYDVQGDWNTGQKQPRVKRRMFPAGRKMAVDDIKKIAANIAAVLETLGEFDALVRALPLALRQKHVIEAPPAGQSGGQIQNQNTPVTQLPKPKG